VDQKESRVAEIEKQMGAADFWNNTEAAQTLISELKSIKTIPEGYRALHRDLEDEIELVEMCDEADDARHLAESLDKIPEMERRLNAIEIRALFTNANDTRDVFLSIHAGSGGVEAMDWAQMLQRMYLRWLAQNGYETKILDELPGEEAGVKRVSIEVKGSFAFGYLKSEIGAHRLVRISPFDANHKRHTSFAAVDVIPVYDEIDVDIDEGDLRIDTYSAGGPGGQHVNKTQSAVRITHLPTGIVVQCQNERSQGINRKVAMKSLASKLHQFEETKREAAFAKMYGEKGEIAFGHQIRSYTLQPFTLVKDKRTGHEEGNVQKVLDGELDGFMEAFLKWKERTY
jgi:peptide chain release factor 2